MSCANEAVRFDKTLENIVGTGVSTPTNFETWYDVCKIFVLCVAGMMRASEAVRFDKNLENIVGWGFYPNVP